MGSNYNPQQYISRLLTSEIQGLNRKEVKPVKLQERVVIALDAYETTSHWRWGQAMRLKIAEYCRKFCPPAQALVIRAHLEV